MLAVELSSRGSSGADSVGGLLVCPGTSKAAGML